MKPRGKPFTKGHGDLRTPEGKARAISALRNLSKGAEAARLAGISRSLKGKKMSAKSLAAIKLANTGRKHSTEEKAKRSVSLLGHKVSEETRAKISRTKKSQRVGAYKTDKNQRARASMQYTAWRDKVYKRDDYTCQKCGEKGGRLHAHHIVNFARVRKLRYSVSNGITLCVKHHRRFHVIYGKSGNTVKQLAEFMT